MEAAKEEDIPDKVDIEETTVATDEESKVVEDLKENDFREKLMSNPDFMKQMKQWQSDPKFKEFQKLL